MVTPMTQVDRDIKAHGTMEEDAIFVHEPDSPVFNDVSISYSTVKFNGSFTHETIYRRAASAEVDAAWAALGAECED
ncbi:hypothetical protein LOZ12_005708 [Ophidiomyces ophidiicola]|nr:hypothetical protein LOZ62_005385 [Ophidiomyces ophidiicola]KAI2033385.1 hypothetical protein LOZ47_005417 [Ophidiomyces ophidiicola]KAI2045956.1 hypothetical protein LOZ38_005638 [Ophidiomyces ophidiicola]KAI2071934.1 hypothetical protein LOZ37_004489 [Ophidiomyces ophidiicola]KAI2096791.1 hypothetical protein LOZ35_002495 [Ophidiomyces ophidiicola]